MRKSCLVLGATGFIGYHIVSELLTDGHEVIGLDIKTTDQFNQNSSYSHYAGAIHPELLQLILTQNHIDVIIFAAGRASVQASFQSPDTDFHENVSTVYAVFNAVRIYSPNTYVIILSSAAVYGNPTKLPILESDPQLPISPYGFHKLQTEIIAKQFTQCFQIRSTLLRIFSCYGEGQRKLLLWDLCNKAMETNQLILKGMGTESRDYIHVSDVSGFIQLLVKKPDEAEQIYNLANGQETSIQFIAEKLVKHLDIKTTIKFEGKLNIGNPENWCADITKMHSLGYNPQINIEEGLLRYAKWFKSLL